MGGVAHQESAESLVPVAAGSLLTLVPQVDGITFNPPQQVVTWKAPHQGANFLFNTPADLDHDLTGRVLVFQGPLITGEIPLVMRHVAPVRAPMRGMPPPTRSIFEALEPVFASYSHKDAAVMEYFRQARAELGQRMLVDIYDLRAGDHWQERLYEMIDESAVFQLFWSAHSAASEYCAREWRHALRHQAARPRFIQPVWWHAPMPPPPEELAHLHFQKIDVALEG